MSEAERIRHMSVDEYLEFEASSDTRHDYVRGRIFAMSGPTHAHSLICGNLYAALHSFLKGSGCRAFMTMTKLRIDPADAFYYPDVFVTCETFKPQDTFMFAPRLIIEVLSPSTQQIDRREKLVAYTTLASLKQYILVYQDRMKVEAYGKLDNGDWEQTALGHSDELHLEALPDRQLVMPVADIYTDLDMPLRVQEAEAEYEPA